MSTSCWTAGRRWWMSAASPAAAVNLFERPKVFARGPLLTGPAVWRWFRSLPWCMKFWLILLIGFILAAALDQDEESSGATQPAARSAAPIEPHADATNPVLPPQAGPRRPGRQPARARSLGSSERPSFNTLSGTIGSD